MEVLKKSRLINLIIFSLVILFLNNSCEEVKTKSKNELNGFVIFSPCDFNKNIYTCNDSLKRKFYPVLITTLLDYGIDLKFNNGEIYLNESEIEDYEYISNIVLKSLDNRWVNLNLYKLPCKQEPPSTIYYSFDLEFIKKRFLEEGYEKVLFPNQENWMKVQAIKNEIFSKIDVWQSGLCFDENFNEISIDDLNKVNYQAMYFNSKNGEDQIILGKFEAPTKNVTDNLEIIFNQMISNRLFEFPKKNLVREGETSLLYISHKPNKNKYFELDSTTTKINNLIDSFPNACDCP